MGNLFNNMLSPGQWLLLSLIPPAIVALYFLKLKRQPLSVPSTYLWHRTLEDLHVNSLWQKMRQNLLMYLQLLLIGLLMLICLRPSWNSQRLAQSRFIFLVDASASMSATDVSPTRLDEAKEKVEQLIQQMRPGDAAMLISFSDRAKVEQPFTTRHRKLKQKLAAIQPTQRASDITEALTAAGGRANPGRTSESGTTDVQVADAVPADVYVFSDGGFRSVPEFSWGNLQPHFISIGKPSPRNLAITTFSAGKVSSDAEQLQAIATIRNFGDKTCRFSASLYLNDALIDAAEYQAEAGDTQGIEFQLDDVARGVLRLDLECDDDFAADNRAYLAVNPREKARILLVTEGNYALQAILSTEEREGRAVVTQLMPESLASEDYRQTAAGGSFDLVIYDQCQPSELPAANTLFFDALPPGNDWKMEDKQSAPQMIDIDVVHPLMNYLDFGDVRFAEAAQVVGPAGQRVLMEMDIGPVGVIAPRAGFEDFVLGFGLLTSADDGERLANSDWRLRLSFPLFFRNVVTYLGGSELSTTAAQSHRPGDTVSFKTSSPQDTVTVTQPSGDKVEVTRSRDNRHHFFGTNVVGVYNVIEDGDQSPNRFTVNLFDTIESDIRPKESLKTAWNEVPSQPGFETKTVAIWRWLLLVAIAILLVEWYVFNKRIV